MEEIERKIYSSFAFSANEAEKFRVNKSIYEELTGKHKVYRTAWDRNLEDIENHEQYDLIIGRKAGYNHGEYRVIKNTTSLTNREIALICDLGNLCFGYKMQGSTYYVFED